MVCQWEPGTQYTHGSVVEYEGHFYKIIQPHQSQADWTPSITPALWGRLPEESCHEYRSGGHHHQQTGGFVDQSSGYHQQPGGFVDQSGGIFWTSVNRSDPIPNNAIEGGREGGHTLYIGRTNYKGGVHVGKVSKHLGGCVIGYGGKEHNDFDKYEILCGDKHAIKWINHSPSHGKIQAQGWKPVEGGREEDGRFLFVCQAQHEGGVHPCKAQDGTDFAIFSYGGKEKTTQEFNILSYA